MSHSRRKMKAYREKEHGGHYVLDDYEWSRNHHKSVTIKRWKRNLKSKARAARRMLLNKVMKTEMEG